jgi:hypothetical protein
MVRTSRKRQALPQDQATRARWILFMPTIPAKPASVRVRIWRCTFEVLVERMGLQDPALDAVGEIIHDLDLRDGKFDRDETPGVRSTIDGICTIARGDDQRITAATPLLDGLHAHFTSRVRRDGRASKRRG